MYTRAFAYFRPELGRITASFLMVAAGTFLGLVPPLTLALLIDTFAPTGNRDFWHVRLWEYLKPETVPAQILMLTLATLAIRLAKELLQMWQTLLNIKIGYRGLMHVRCRLFDKLQQLSIGYHRSQPQGDAIYRLSWDTFGFQGLYNVVFGSLVNVLTLGFMLAIMLSFNWQLTLVSLAVVPFLIWAIRAYAKVMQDYSTAAAEADSKLTTAIQRSVAAISLVQAFGRERDEYSRFSTTVESSISAWMKLHYKEVVYWLVLGTIFTVSSVALFGYGGWLVYKGDLTVGLLTAFLGYLQGFYDPLNKLSASGSAYQKSLAGVRRVFEVMDREAAVRDGPGARALAVAPRRLELENVTFSYREGAPVLREVSCSIAPGSMVAFVGSSGVGKTTLLSLLPRFYDPSSGRILLDGNDAKEIKLSDLRRHVALVLQENIVLPTTVAENIAYGRPDASAAEIRRAAELAGAWTFIEKLEHGLDTEVSELGGNLSGGQRQRIGIARALLTRAPIIVLDEPTSALDPQTEQHITETLTSLKGTHTLVIVSHRLSTVLGCDRIFVMHEGRIVEQGTHDELVALRGQYYAMARHQLQLG
jgi:ABC-type multidrug transport system fused ATPase/permease subunit